MRAVNRRRHVAVSVTLLLSLGCMAAPVHAQDATVTGQVVDASKAVLPGVTVTATSIATGRQFVDMSGADGLYRLVGLPPNVYTIRAELTGFGTAQVENVELLVGQNASIGFVLQLAALAETINVTAQQPLIDVSSAQVGGNVDRRQMAELPIVGRNWMGLSLMVKGVTGNDTAGNTAGGMRRESMYQLNLDGQQIKQNFAGASSFSQPVISREAIAEYQVVTNLFDVTMGRSSGLQVQAISRSGTNDLHGSAFGFFRDDALNSADFVANRVLPYSNQQVGGSFGGPLKVNKLHFFTAYEYEREPTTTVVQPPRYASSITVPGGTRTHSALARTDAQIGAAGNLTVRATYAKPAVPSGDLLGTQYPSFQATLDRKSFFLTANHTKAFANNLLQEIRGGYFRHFSARTAAPGVAETPTYAFPGLSIGTRSNYPQEFVERVFTARYDLNWTKGRHDLKIGGEWLGVLDEACWPSRVRGQYDYSAIPADIERRFPLDAWDDPSRWDFTGLDSTLLRYRVAYAEPGGGYENCGNFGVHLPRPTYAVWFGDTWRVTDSLTLNLGLRYDLAWGDLRTPFVPETELVINNGLFTENVGYRPDRVDPNNLAPRFGFSYDASGEGRLVFRGGTGLFYTDNTGIFQLFQQLNNGFRAIQSEYRNDGLPGFFQDPTRGVTPEQVLSGQVPLPPQAINVMNTNLVMPYTWQSTVGVQKQLTDVMAFDADLIYWRTYDEDIVRDPNLLYNPATGFNFHPTTVGRPAPQNGTIELYESEGKSDYLALATSLTRRFANSFQAYATYTVMFFKHDMGQGLYGNYGNYPNNPFDREAEWARSGDFQRHTIRANGIWRLPMNFSAAGTFSFGSGNYFQPTSPVNPYGATGTIRVLADGTVLERNSFQGEALHKLDLRLSKTFTIAGVTLEGTAEVFNVYNHANYGSYNMVYGASNFGQPVQNLATAYLPRLWQLGGRLSF